MTDGDPCAALAAALAAVVRQAVADAVADQQGGAGGGGELLVDVREAAHRLALGTTTVKRLIASGRLPSCLIEGRRLVGVADLERFAASA